MRKLLRRIRLIIDSENYILRVESPKEETLNNDVQTAIGLRRD